MFPTFEGRGAFKDPEYQFILCRQSKQKHIHAQSVQAQPLESLVTQATNPVGVAALTHNAQQTKLEVKIAAKHRETYGLTNNLHVKLVKCI